jgi:ABC-type polysaccharide/polyol phosphate export permease
MILINILIKNFHIWFFLSMHEVKKRYRRSIIGPFWVVLSNIIIILILSLIYSIILKKNLEWYILYLSFGFILWQNISSNIGEAPETFIRSAPLIKNYRISNYNYIFRDVSKNFINLIHNFPYWIFILIWFEVKISLYTFSFIISYFILFLNMTWINTILALVSLRFRDFNSLISVFIQLSFFATPVLWDVSHILEARPQLSWVIYLNPFYHLIEIFRQPLMLGIFPTNSFIFCILMLIFGITFANYLMRKYSHRVAFWL